MGESTLHPSRATAPYHAPDARLVALQREIREQVTRRASGVDARFWGPTLRLMAEWADRLAAITNQEPR